MMGVRAEGYGHTNVVGARCTKKIFLLHRDPAFADIYHVPCARGVPSNNSRNRDRCVCVLGESECTLFLCGLVRPLGALFGCDLCAIALVFSENGAPSFVCFVICCSIQNQDQLNSAGGMLMRRKPENYKQQTVGAITRLGPMLELGVLAGYANQHNTTTTTAAAAVVGKCRLRYNGLNTPRQILEKSNWSRRAFLHPANMYLQAKEASCRRDERYTEDVCRLMKARHQQRTIVAPNVVE